MTVYCLRRLRYHVLFYPASIRGAYMCEVMGTHTCFEFEVSYSCEIV